MITPAFGLTATERVLPKLALDFTTALLDSRVTFTRTTGASNPATYFNSSGLLTQATNDQPRFDYNPVTLVCKGLLIEESRQNRFVGSNDLSNVAWTVNAALGYTASATTSPTGNADAIKLVPTATTATMNVYQATTLVSGTAYTHTVYAKAGEVGILQINSSTGFVGSGSYYRNYDLINGVLGSGTSTATVPASIEAVGNGWYRCSYTDTASGSVSGRCAIVVVPSATSARNATFTGNGVDGLFVYGAQMEAGAFATSYIPTTTTALTRNADVATMTGTNFSDWFNASEGTVVSSFVLNGYSSANQDRVLSITDGASAEIDIRQNTSSQIAFNVAGGASGSAAIAVVPTAVAGANYTVAGAYKTNDIAAAANAGTVGTDSSCAVPVVNQMRLGVNSSGSPTTVLCGTIQKISYFPIRLTNAEIQAFSKG